MVNNIFEQVKGRDISALLNPRPIALITTRSNATDYIATCAWTSPASHEPPMLTFALRPNGITAQAITQSKSFVINLIDQHYAHAARICGSPIDTDRFYTSNLETIDAKTIDAPVLLNALAYFECKLTEQVNTGDHDLFIGEVLFAAKQSTIDKTYEKTLLCLERAKFDSLDSLPFTIRPANSNDAQELVELFWEEDMGTPSDDDEVYVAMNSSGDLLGAIRLENYPGQVFVRPIVVHKTHQKQGVGRSLITDALQRKGKLFLVSRGKAHGFYKKLGFQELSWDQIPSAIRNECDFCMNRESCNPVPMKLEISELQQ